MAMQNTSDVHVCAIAANRRQEYDDMKRQRRRQKEGRSSRAPKSPSFHSSFVPPDVQTSSNAEEDLRHIDPMYLFSRMFPDFNFNTSTFSDLGSSSGLTRGKMPRKMEENHQSMHVNRYGGLSLNKSSKSFEMHNNGGFTFSSSSFTSSFGGDPSSQSMLASMQSVMGSSSSTGLGLESMMSSMMPSMFGNGVPTASPRQRRQSLIDGYGSPSWPPQRNALQRSPSLLSWEDAYGSPVRSGWDNSKAIGAPSPRGQLEPWKSPSGSHWPF